MIITARFNSRCGRCGEPLKVGESVEWTRGYAATHVSTQGCEYAKQKAAAARASTQVLVPQIDLLPIVRFLEAAQQRGLKNPKLRVLGPDGKSEVRLSLTKHGSAPGSLAVVEREIYIGSIRPNGTVTGPLAQNTAMQNQLLGVAQNPANAAKEYAALMCICSFCGKPLTDAGSVEVGYGPICAAHWGLPHHPKGTPALQAVGAL